MDYAAYKKSRYPEWSFLSTWGIPISVKAAKNDYYVQARPTESALRYRRLLADLKARVDFDWVDRSRYGAYLWDGPLPAELVPEGFDPAHLTLRLKLTPDEWSESCETRIKESGARLEPKRDDWRTGHAVRPVHHAISFDYSGPRDRSDPHWVWYPEGQHKDFLYGTSGAFAGLARGPANHLRLAHLRDAAQRLSDSMEDYMRDRILPYIASATILWRGEEVGSDSLGGIDVSQPEDAIEAILDYGMIDTAIDQAIKWADTAVTEAQQRALTIVRQTALLPSRALEKAREREEAELAAIAAKTTPIRKRK